MCVDLHKFIILRIESGGENSVLKDKETLEEEL